MKKKSTMEKRRERRESGVKRDHQICFTDPTETERVVIVMLRCFMSSV